MLQRQQKTNPKQKCSEYYRIHVNRLAITKVGWKLSGPISRDAGSDAMRVTMRAKHETAMRCDAKILAMRVLAAEILCDALPRCENTSDAMPRRRPLRLEVAVSQSLKGTYKENDLNADNSLHS